MHTAKIDVNARESEVTQKRCLDTFIIHNEIPFIVYLNFLVKYDYQKYN